MEALDLRIEELIKKDLSTLAMRAGLKNSRFVSTNLIQERILPVRPEHQAHLYRELILRNIENVEPIEIREALYVKLNLCDGYSDNSSQERLGELGRKRGRVVPEEDSPKGGGGDSRSTRIQAAKGEAILADLILRDILWRNEHNAWDELLREVYKAAASKESSGPPQGNWDASQAQVSVSPSGQSATSTARAEVNPSMFRAHVASFPLTGAVSEALEAARATCKTTDRYFHTPDLLLAILDLPNSRVARCFEETKPGFSREWRRKLIAYRQRVIADDKFRKYKDFDWADRADVFRAKALAWLDEQLAADELYLLLGILSNHRSGTRLDMEAYLGAQGYGRLCQIAEWMREGYIR
jgi:hypothetical protein